MDLFSQISKWRGQNYPSSQAINISSKPDGYKSSQSSSIRTIPLIDAHGNLIEANLKQYLSQDEKSK